MRKKLIILMATFTLLGSFLAACKETTTPVSNDSVVYEQVSTGGFKISVSPQDARDGIIVIGRVEAPSTSWLAIHKSVKGEPGEVIGYTELETGVSQNISIQIDTALATPTLFAVIHADTGAIGEFEYPQFDPPVEAGGKMVQVSFHALVEGGDVYVTVKDQEIENENVLIDEIFVFTPPVWVVIFNDKDGQPDEVIGYEYVSDGSVEYVPVDVDTEKVTPTLYAFLYEDKGDLGEFNINQDPVLLSYGEPVMTTFQVTLP